jgi:hypothetical protein
MVGDVAQLNPLALIVIDHSRVLHELRDEEVTGDGGQVVADAGGAALGGRIIAHAGGGGGGAALERVAGGITVGAIDREAFACGETGGLTVIDRVFTCAIRERVSTISVAGGRDVGHAGLAAVSGGVGADGREEVEVGGAALEGVARCVAVHAIGGEGRAGGQAGVRVRVDRVVAGAGRQRVAAEDLAGGGGLVSADARAIRPCMGAVEGGIGHRGGARVVDAALQGVAADVALGAGGGELGAGGLALGLGGVEEVAAGAVGEDEVTVGVAAGGLVGVDADAAAVGCGVGAVGGGVGGGGISRVVGAALEGVAVGVAVVAVGGERSAGRLALGVVGVDGVVARAVGEDEAAVGVAGGVQLLDADAAAIHASVGAVGGGVRGGGISCVVGATGEGVAGGVAFGAEVFVGIAGEAAIGVVVELSVVAGAVGVEGVAVLGAGGAARLGDVEAAEGQRGRSGAVQGANGEDLLTGVLSLAGGLAVDLEAGGELSAAGGGQLGAGGEGPTDLDALGDGIGGVVCGVVGRIVIGRVVVCGVVIGRIVVDCVVVYGVVVDRIVVCGVVVDRVVVGRVVVIAALFVVVRAGSAGEEREDEPEEPEEVERSLAVHERVPYISVTSWLCVTGRPAPGLLYSRGGRAVQGRRSGGGGLPPTQSSGGGLECGRWRSP